MRRKTTGTAKAQAASRYALNPIKEQTPHPHQPFAFTERERLFDRLSHPRFEALLRDEQTTIHDVKLDTNLYGEFLFVTLSHQQAAERQALTFFGLGFHEHRERWLTTWSWYETDLRGERQKSRLDKPQVLEQIAARHAEVVSYGTPHQSSKRAQLYTLLADLTDEDGALSEMEDLDDWLLDE